MKKRKSAIFIAFFLGWAGGQKFYFGKWIQGTLCLIFFWTIIPYIIAIIDFYILLLQSDESFDKEYNTPKPKAA
jgi:TM2 domain-containing membrane protein YozV